MSFVLFVYFASLADKLNVTLSVTFAVAYTAAVVALLFCFLLSADWEKQERNFSYKFFKVSLSVAVVCNILYVVIPTQKTMWLMAGAYYAQELAENPKVQNIGSNVLDVVNLKLEALEKELKQEVVSATESAANDNTGDSK